MTVQDQASSRDSSSNSNNDDGKKRNEKKKKRRETDKQDTQHVNKSLGGFAGISAKLIMGITHTYTCMHVHAHVCVHVTVHAYSSIAEHGKLLFLNELFSDRASLETSSH